MNYTLKNLTKQESDKLVMLKTTYNLKTKEDAIKLLINRAKIKITEEK